MPPRNEGQGRWGGPLRQVAVALCLVGCRFTPWPDPNDPQGAGIQQPDVLRRQVNGASDALLAREAGGEITDAQYRDLLARYTDGLLKGIRVESLDPKKAWEYGMVFRAGRLWPKAEAAFRLAVEGAPDLDRKVNDTLRLAEAEAQQGRVEEAVRTARETFDSPYKVPILYSVLYEIVPAGQGKGHDADLARLLEDAIRQSDRVRVNEATPEGRAFAMALPHHQHNARELAARLYLAAGRSSDAERVLSGNPPTIRI